MYGRQKTSTPAAGGSRRGGRSPRRRGTVRLRAQGGHDLLAEPTVRRLVEEAECEYRGPGGVAESPRAARSREQESVDRPQRREEAQQRDEHADPVVPTDAARHEQVEYRAEPAERRQQDGEDCQDREWAVGPAGAAEWEDEARDQPHQTRRADEAERRRLVLVLHRAVRRVVDRLDLPHRPEAVILARQQEVRDLQAIHVALLRPAVDHRVPPRLRAVEVRGQVVDEAEGHDQRGDDAGRRQRTPRPECDP